MIECNEITCFYYSKSEEQCIFDECVVYCKNCGEPLLKDDNCDFCGEEQ